MFNSHMDRTSLKRKQTLGLFFLGAVPLIVAIALATYYANQKRPSTILAAELSNLAPIGEIVVGSPVEQHFLCPVDEFESFRLRAATYARTNSAKYKVTLSGGPLDGKEDFLIESANIKDNAWVDFKLRGAWKRCKGRTLRIGIVAIDAVPGNALTFYTASPYYNAKITLPKKLELENRQLALEVNTAVDNVEKLIPPFVDASKDKNQVGARLDTPSESQSELKANYDNIGHFGELTVGKVIEQSISCPVGKLKSISVLAATFVRKNKAQYKLSLADGADAPQVLSVAAIGVRDNGWISFVLPRQIEKCSGRKLTLKIESNDAKLGDALSFYHKPAYYSGALIAPNDPAFTGRQLLIEMNR